MGAAVAGYKYIVLNKNGRAVIAGTGIKVDLLIAEKMAYGWSPEEMQFQHPHVSLAQIYSALAYFADHESEILERIEKDRREYEQGREAFQKTPLAKKLRAAKAQKRPGIPAK